MSWANIEVEGESGAGLVKVVMTCKHDVKRVTIDPSLLAEDKDMLEDLVAAAFNAAVRKAEETSNEKMAQADCWHAWSARWDEVPLLNCRGLVDARESVCAFPFFLVFRC